MCTEELRFEISGMMIEKRVALILRKSTVRLPCAFCKRFQGSLMITSNDTGEDG